MPADEKGHMKVTIPQIKEQKDYYDARWANQGYLNPFALERLIMILEMIKASGLQSPAILDLGCGTGWLTAILNEIGPSTGIELSEDTIKSAKTKYPGPEFISGNLFEIKIPDSSFDIVVSQEVVEHVEDQKAYLAIAANSLKDKGYLILTTPNARNFSHWSKDALSQWNLQPIENWHTSRELVALLKPEFHVLNVSTIIPKFGSRVIFRLLSSVKINKMLSLLKLQHIKNKIALRLGLGLHIVVLAMKKEQKAKN